jgi:hypothetical protein
MMSDELIDGSADERKRMLALLMLKQLQQNQPSVQQPPGGYNAPGILGKLPLSAVLMNAGAQGLTQMDLASADRSIADRKQRMQQDYLKGVQSFSDSPDKEQAIAAALSNPNPLIRQMAEAQAKVMREQKEKEAERKQKAAIEAAKLRGDFGDLPGAEQTLRDTTINPNAPLPAPKQPVFSENATSDGKKIPTMTNFNSKGVPTATMGGGGAETKVEITNDMRQEGEASKAFGKVSPEVLKEVRGSAQKAIQGLESSERILNVLKDPAVMTGSFAEPRLFAAKVGELLGFRGPEGIGQTQSLMSELANQTLAQVRRLPGAITEKERPFLEMAAAGKLDYTPEAMRRLAEIAQVASHNELMDLREQYNNTIQLPGVGQNAGMFPFPKGWRFQTNPETMEPQGPNSDRWRMKAGALGQPTPKPSSGGKPSTSKPIAQMTEAEKRAEIARLEAELRK